MTLTLNLRAIFWYGSSSFSTVSHISSKDCVGNEKFGGNVVTKAFGFVVRWQQRFKIGHTLRAYENMG